MGGPWQAAAASVRAVVFLLDGNDASAKAVAEIRQLLGMNDLLHVPVMLLASRSPGSSEADGKERTSGANAGSGTGTALEEEREALKRSLNLAHVLGGTAGGQRVELFVLAGTGGEGGLSGCEAALEWLGARVA